MHTRNRLKTILLSCWVILTFTCFFVVLPSVGREEPLPSAQVYRWPESSEISRVTNTAQLVVFVHPYCPCTRATLNNLDEYWGAVAPKVTIVQLRTERLETIHTPIPTISKLAEKKGWNLVFDTEGLEARRFGAQVSGECFLFDCKGRLTFAGGITSNRGHKGLNKSLETLMTIANMYSVGKCDTSEIEENSRVPTEPNPQLFPAFGCPLFSETGCGQQSLDCRQIVNSIN